MEFVLIIFAIGCAIILLFYTAIGLALLGFALMVRHSRKIYWEVHGRPAAKARVHERVLHAAKQCQKPA